jgi:folate-binding protein YgfZ
VSTQEESSWLTIYLLLLNSQVIYNHCLDFRVTLPVPAFLPLGQEVATDEQLQWHRVLAGTPWFGIDSTTDTLPQELQRDDKAISFTKGCYLGQETVARIDALGRVNKLLVRLKAKKPISVGQSLEFGEKEVGTISSVATNGDEFLALAIVRRAATTKGSILNEATTPIEVI